MKKLSILLLSLLLCVGSLSAKSFMQEQLTERKQGAFGWKGLVNWQNGRVEVRGIGAPPKGKEYSRAQWRPMAIRAAKVSGYRDLAEVVYGVRVTSETEVKGEIVKDDTIKTKVDAYIQGFAVSDPKYLSDGTVEVVVSLPMYGKDGLSQIMFPSLFQKGGNPKNKKKSLKERIREFEQKLKRMQQELEELKKQAAEESRILLPFFFAFNTAPGDDYTGLIVEGKHPDPGLKPVMAPEILSESGKELYGTLNIDPEVAIEKGIVSYADSVEAAKKIGRAGENPMIVKAVNFSGSFQADPVITDTDAERILASNLPDLFPYCPVIIVTN